MTQQIHPTAVIDEGAQLADGVKIGPYAVIGADVEIGEGTEIGAHAVIEGPARIGRENLIFPSAAIGLDPQDLKYEGERSSLEIGDRNTFREFCTVNRGTSFGGWVTVIGDDNLFMTHTHIGHDSRVGSRCVFTNGATLAGHVLVEDDVSIAATSAVHQFCRVGRHAYIGAYSAITMDALPFCITVGLKPQCIGLNRIGLQRKGVEEAVMRELEKATRVLLRSGLNTTQALDELRALEDPAPAVQDLIEFVAGTERGIIRSERRGSRGGRSESS